MIASVDSSVTSLPLAKPVDEVLKTVSASRLQLFHQCRLKFYFRYVLRLAKPRTSALFFGSMVHSVLQSWNLTRWRIGQVDQDALKQKLESEWIQDQKKQPVTWEAGEEQKAKADSWSLFETYLQQTPITLDERPEGVEVSLEVDLTNRGLPRLIGILDLVRKGGRIVDFKTASTTPTREKVEHMHEVQLSCYSLLYRASTGRTEGGRELHHLVKLKTPKVVITEFPPMTQQQEIKLFRIMESYVNGIQNEDWIPSPSPMSCACCEFFKECRNWS